MYGRHCQTFPLVACLALLATGGCTLVKPVAGAIVGPVVLLGASNGDLGGCGCDARGVLAACAVAAGVGAAVGLVTGVVSDVQALSGAAEDATANWWHPLKTNTSE